MQMTNEEIVRDYTQAANKNKQIKILADLNQTSPSEIQTILAKEGVEGVKMPARIAKRRSEAKAPGPASDLDEPFFDRVETILSALPENLSDEAAVHTQNLLQTLFADYLEQRLGKGGQHGT